MNTQRIRPVSIRKTASRFVLAAVALAAVGAGSGFLSPHVAHAQTLSKPNNDAHDRAKVNNEAPDRAKIGDLVSTSSPATPAPVKDGQYEATKRTKGGYSVTIQSRAKFGTVIAGNYLFIVTPDSGYLFTKKSGGLLLLPEGWGVTAGGDLVDPKGGSTRVSDKPVTIPQGITVSVGKDGACTLIMPNQSTFILRDNADKQMNPSGMYYD